MRGRSKPGLPQQPFVPQQLFRALDIGNKDDVRSGSAGPTSSLVLADLDGNQELNQFVMGGYPYDLGVEVAAVRLEVDGEMRPHGVGGGAGLNADVADQLLHAEFSTP